MNQLTAMLASMVIEAAVVSAWGAWKRRPVAPLALVAIGATALTHPVAWWTISERGDVPYSLAFVLVELAVVVLEALAYRGCARLRPRRAVGVALLANAASAAAGLIYFAAMR